MKKKISKSFSIFSETGKELVEIARKYCNFQFDRKYNIAINGVNYEFFVSSEDDTVTVSKFKYHEKVRI